MAAKHLFTAAAVLLLVNSAVGVVNSCTLAEQSLLYNKCLLSFGFAHWMDWPAMKISSSCLTEKLQCPAARAVVECINTIKPHELKDPCWDGLKGALTAMLLEYKFGCTFNDIETKCRSTAGFPRVVIKSAAARNRAAAAGGRPPM